MVDKQDLADRKPPISCFFMLQKNQSEVRSLGTCLFVRKKPWVHKEFNFTEPPQEVHHCYELLSEYGPLRSNFKFWLEGVAITVLGVVGLAGNVMAVCILRKYTSNISFNRLLIR